MKLNFSWPCPFCPFVGESRRKLEKHKNDEHKGERQKVLFAPGGNCQYCGRECKRKCELTVHEKRCFKNPNRIEYKKHLQTEETRQKIKETNKIRHSLGGYRKGSGRGKKGWYKGYFCDSSWELAYVIYNLEHGIQFERNKKTFTYAFNNKEYHYLPDFIVDGKYVEIKGFWTEQWQAKKEQFPSDETLLIISENEMKIYLDYVKDKYGKDFIKLYDKSH